MKIENITIKRRQISFSDKEFADINNARRWLRNALQITQDKELQRAVDELENVLNNIEIQDNGKYYVFSEEIWRDDA
jgi:hypothetical protein